MGLGKSTIFVIFVVLQIAVGVVNAILHLDNEAELRDAQAAFLNADSDSGWILLNFIGPNTVHFEAGGEGGASEFVPYLDDYQIQYMLVRENKPADANPIQDVFIQWTGPGVDSIERRKKSAFYADAALLLQPFDSSIVVISRAYFDGESN